MNRSIAKIALLLVATFAASSSNADDWDITGFVGLDTQAFWHDGQYQGQENGLNLSLIVQPEFYWRSDDSRQRISVVGFARLDADDDERTITKIDASCFVAERNRLKLAVLPDTSALT